MIILPLAAYFVLDGSLPLPLVYAFGVFLRGLSELLHSVSAVSSSPYSASFSETIHSKEESRKEELVWENSDDD